MEGVVQAVNRQYFTDARIVVKYFLSAISRRIEVPDGGVGDEYEGRLAENHQRLRGAGQKPFPEYVKCHRRFRNLGGRTGCGGSARQKAVRRHRHDRRKHDGHHKQYAEPGARSLDRVCGTSWRLRGGSGDGSWGNRGARVECKSIVSLGEFHQDWIFDTLRDVILSQLGPQTPSLHANHRIYMGIEVLLASKDLCRNLVLLGGSSGMFQGMICQIPQKLAERLRSVEGVTGKKFLALSERKRFVR